MPPNKDPQYIPVSRKSVGILESAINNKTLGKKKKGNENLIGISIEHMNDVIASKDIRANHIPICKCGM